MLVPLRLQSLVHYGEPGAETALACETADFAARVVSAS
jgi:hypothetical protein